METAPILRFSVPFDEADGEGIVFFGNYFRLAHRALEQWLPAIGIPWEDWFSSPAFGVPLRHAEADYLGALYPGRQFDVRLRVGKLGDSSVQFLYEFLTPDGQTLARLQTVHVFVQRQEKKKLAIPAPIRERLESVRAQT